MIQTKYAIVRPIPALCGCLDHINKEVIMAEPDILKIYEKSIKDYNSLSTKESNKLFANIKKNKDAIINSNLKLVVYYAKLFATDWDVDVMDLIQEGNIGVIKAVDNFNPKKGFKLITYMSYYIKGSMITWIKNNNLIPRYKTKSQRIILNNLIEIKEKFNEAGVTITDISQEYNVNEVDLHDQINYRTYNINDPSIQKELIDYADPESIRIKSEGTERVWRKILSFRGTLNSVEKCIFDTRLYKKTKTLDELSGMFGLDFPQQIKRIENKVLVKAKEYFSREDLEDVIER